MTLRSDTLRVQRSASIKAAPSGKGAAYAFDGNQNVGRGTIEIVDTAPASRVTMTLHMLEPFETRNTVDFILQPRGDTTFIDMDRMVGGEFEAGLASLKTIAEKTP